MSVSVNTDKNQKCIFDWLGKVEKKIGDSSLSMLVTWPFCYQLKYTDIRAYIKTAGF